MAKLPKTEKHNCPSCDQSVTFNLGKGNKTTAVCKCGKRLTLTRGSTPQT